VPSVCRRRGALSVAPAVEPVETTRLVETTTTIEPIGIGASHRADGSRS
jgi:ketopantoate hydroxymethyltransferase